MQEQCLQDRIVKRHGRALFGGFLAAVLIAAAIPLGTAFAQQPATPPAADPSPSPPPAASQPQAEPEDNEAPPRSRRDRRQTRRDRMEERADRLRERRYARGWRRSMGPFGLAPLCGPGFGRKIDNDMRRIARAVSPTDAQRGPFDDLKTAAAKARGEAQEGCDEPAAKTPIGRMKAIDERLASVQQSVHTLRPALDTFYASLNDEQKERFDTLNLSMTTGGGEAAPREHRRRWRRHYHRAWGWPFWGWR